MVECRTPEREVGGSKPTAALLCPWARHFTLRKYWLITQEAVAPSRHDWKIVDCDIKPQHKQTNLSHRQPAKAQMSLRIRTVSPEPSLFTHIKYGSRRRIRPNISPIGWLSMRIWRMSLRRMKRTVIWWRGADYCCNCSKIWTRCFLVFAGAGSIANSVDTFASLLFARVCLTHY